MENSARLTSVLAAAALLVLAVASCGDEDDPTGTTRSTATTAEAENRESRGDGGERGSEGRQNAGGSRRDSGGGSAQYRVPGGDNSVQNFGEEADDATRQQAAAVLHGYLDARAAGDWARACAYLAADAREMLLEASTKSEQLKGKSCGGIVAAFSRGAEVTLRVEAAQADVGSLRIEDGRGFILFRGIEGTVYAAPMSEEDGRWKLATIVSTPLS